MSAVLALTSCNDFLDKYPKYGVDPESEVTNEIAVALTTACYKTLQSSNMYNQRIWSLDIIAGNSEVGAGGGTDGLETVQASNFIAQSDNGFALYVWRSPWVGIGRCNIVLSNLPSASVSNEIKTRCMGEAYFLRAHYYYILVRLYGGVPLRLEPFEPGESADIARNTVDEVYAQILSDCKNAVNMLPPKSSYGDADRGRACKEAAMAMLADIYLTLAPNHRDYYNEVVTLCNNIAAMGYDLTQCNYADNFNATINNGAESLFEVQYSGSTEYDFWEPVLMDGTCLRKSLSSNTRTVICGKTSLCCIRVVLLLTVWNTDVPGRIRVITYVSSLCRKPSLRSIIPTPTTL